MKRSLLLSLLAVASACTSTPRVADPPVAPRPVASPPVPSDPSPGEALRLVLEEGLGQARPEVVAALLGETYTEHDPGLPDGPAGILGHVAGLATHPPGARSSLRVLRTLDDPPYVAAHSEESLPGGERAARFDVFRLREGKLVEHWSARMLERDPPDEAAGRRGLLEGPVEVRDREQSVENRLRIQRFVDEVLIERREVVAHFVSDELIQHDPRLDDGPAAWARDLDLGPLVHTRLERVIGEGDLVLTQCHGTLEGTAVVIYDLFRLEAGLVVEHWNVWEAVPGQPAHENGML
ncbi:MAG: hypothetical protein P1V51_11225 [Deltaproteobacteria bacterium]|nr:hypothetical protein [Deltaproteobacteria bacterium]